MSVRRQSSCFTEPFRQLFTPFLLFLLALLTLFFLPFSCCFLVPFSPCSHCFSYTLSKSPYVLLFHFVIPPSVLFICFFYVSSHFLPFLPRFLLHFFILSLYHSFCSSDPLFVLPFFFPIVFPSFFSSFALFHLLLLASFLFPVSRLSFTSLFQLFPSFVLLCRFALVSFFIISS